MSKGIIQTAVPQKAHGLEFDYCEPSTSQHGVAVVGGLTPHAELTASDDELRMWDRITYLFRMI